MNARQRINKVQRLIIDLPEPSRKTILGWIAGIGFAVMSLLSGFHCNLKSNQDKISIKIDSVAVLSKPRYALASKLDTMISMNIKTDSTLLAQQKYMKNMMILFQEHIINDGEMTHIAIEGHREDSTDIAFLKAMIISKSHF